MTYEATISTTSSPGSACGATPCGAPDGPTTGASRPAPALANLSPRQASEAGLLTSGTFGPRSIISSASAAFLSSLESRLRAKTASLGSTLYRLTWKARVTPGGRSISALRASVRPISVNVYSLCGWPTPLVNDTKGPQSGPNRTGGNDLSSSARLASWPAPCAQDGPNGGPAQGKDRLPGCVPLTGWSTPTCPVNTNGHQAGNNRYVTSVTHATRDLRYAIRGRLTAFGEMEIGCCVEILPESQSGAPLNPAHSRWLMGLPDAWDSCGGMETPSTRKSRRASSKR